MNIIETYFAYKLLIGISFYIGVGFFLLCVLAHHLYDEHKYKRNGKVKRK